MAKPSSLCDSKEYWMATSHERFLVTGVIFNWRTLGPRIMKVDREVGHDLQKTSIDFGLKRSKFKVTGARNSKTIY